MNKKEFDSLLIEDILDIMEPWLVGLWRFREAGKKKMWCCTFCIDGEYNDTWPSLTVRIALWKVYQELKKQKLVAKKS